jgi:hypothetical protein
MVLRPLVCLSSLLSRPSALLRPLLPACAVPVGGASSALLSLPRSQPSRSVFVRVSREGATQALENLQARMSREGVERLLKQREVCADLNDSSCLVWTQRAFLNTALRTCAERCVCAEQGSPVLRSMTSGARERGGALPCFCVGLLRARGCCGGLAWRFSKRCRAASGEGAFPLLRALLNVSPSCPRLPSFRPRPILCSAT